MKRVLNVGQCVPDNGSITQMLQSNFDVTVETADTHDDAIRLASESDFDLVLINRIYDATGSEGMETLKAIKSDATTQHVPVMLVSNHHDAQEAAIAAGGEEGFGKSALQDSQTIDRLRKYLADA